MISSREAILSALFTLLQSATFAEPVDAIGSMTWVTTSRRLKLWNDVSSGQKPALYITDHGESVKSSSPNLPSISTIEVELFVYIDANDPNAIPSRVLNIALDAIFAALAPTAGFQQTLGGLVTSCRVEGRILKDPGDLDGQGLAVIPVRILCP